MIYIHTLFLCHSDGRMSLSNEANWKFTTKYTDDKITIESIQKRPEFYYSTETEFIRQNTCMKNWRISKANQTYSVYHFIYLFMNELLKDVPDLSSLVDCSLYCV